MERFFGSIEKMNRIMDIVGACILLFMMLLTAADVILRYMKIPIIGTYELVSFAGALVVACAFPQSSWQRSHISVDLVTEKMSQVKQKVMLVVTRLMAMALFILFTWNLYDMATTLRTTRESSMTLGIPLYPLAFALAVCCAAECVVLFFDIVRIFAARGGQHE